MNRLTSTSSSILDPKIAVLRDAFPEVFTEGRIDFTRLRQALGDFTESGSERYGLNWAGRSEAIQNVQAPSVGTLLPMRDESVNWETTQNVVIEGDNLEVLKLLQDGYHARVKLICIDPPYNTGAEFIYPDNFKEGLTDYLRYSGQVDGQGLPMSTNTETNGRFHSKWLSMMYPRLLLARSFLRDDGIIAVFADFHEHSNLRFILNEVFGEENFVADIVWQKRTSPDSRKLLSAAHDSIVIYARHINSFKNVAKRMPLSLARRAEFKNPDGDPRGPWASVDITGQAGHATQDQFYTIVTPEGAEHTPPPGRCWAITQREFLRLQDDGRIWFGLNGRAKPRQKKFLSEAEEEGQSFWTWWTNKEVGDNQEATREVNELIGESEFDINPKPVRLVQRLIQLATDSDGEDIIFDFFAGSGTTGHAVLRQNAEDGGNRQFVLVQLPEPTGDRRLPTVAALCRRRLESVLAKPEYAGAGFRSFRLSDSNFKVWDDTVGPEDVERQLRLVVDNIRDDRSNEDVLLELLLRVGLPLTSPVHVVKDPTGRLSAYSVGNGELLICLERNLTAENIRAFAQLKPVHLICLDTAFHGNDTAKLNAKLELDGHGIRFETA